MKNPFQKHYYLLIMYLNSFPLKKATEIKKNK